MTRREHAFTAVIFAVAAAVASTAASSQSELDAAANRERQLVDMNNWGGAINVFLQNQLYDSQELRELEEKLIALGGCDVARESYRRLMYYDEASAETWLNRAATIVRAADSELVCSQNQRPAVERAALELYREAYELLERNAVARASIDELFAPEVPIRLTGSLPARAKPIPSAAPSNSFEHIDIAFEITKSGRAQRIEIIDSTPNCTDEEKQNFSRWLRDGLYRPRAANARSPMDRESCGGTTGQTAFIAHADRGAPSRKGNTGRARSDFRTYDELYWGDRATLCDQAASA